MKPERIIKLLEPHLSDSRIERLNQAIENRTRQVVTVLEKPYDPGNINAAMRSAEAFGFQDFHIIEGPKHHRPNGRTSAGAGKWLSVHKWKQAKECFDELKSQGYVLIGTSGEATKTIHDVDFSKQKTALVFGSEHAGLSEEADKLVDYHVKIPIVGLVESFNLSVAVALTLHTAFAAFGNKNIEHLSDKEKLELLAEFYIRSVPNAKKILDSTL